MCAGRVQIFASLAAYPATEAYTAGRVRIFASLAAYPATEAYPAGRE